MKDTLESIRDGLRRNSFVNEASVSQGIVLRLLRELGWETFDVDIVSPGYSVKGHSVDFALCCPKRQPRIFLEVEYGSKTALDFDEQFATCAKEERVPLVVLTNGDQWYFCVPHGSGRFVDRCIHRIDLLEDSSDEIVNSMNRYLDYGAVRSGAAFDNVHKDLQDLMNSQIVKRELPTVWARLLRDPSPALAELVMQALESSTGNRPQVKIVSDFLRRQAEILVSLAPFESDPSSHNPVVLKPKSKRRPQKNVAGNFAGAGSLSMVFLGRRETFHTHRARLKRAFELLAERDSGIYAAYARQAIPGHRPGIARHPIDLFPRNRPLADRPDVYAKVGQNSDWYIDLNQSGEQMASMIERACKLVGLKFGRDVILD